MKIVKAHRMKMNEYNELFKINCYYKYIEDKSFGIE